MSLKYLAILLVLFSTIQIHAREIPTDYDMQVDKIRILLDSEKAHEALVFIQSLQKQGANFDTTILTARSYTILNDPKMALVYYQAALNFAKGIDEKHAAYFGIAKMQLWLNNKKVAEKYFRLLLGDELSEEDQAIAKDGLREALEVSNTNPLDAVRQYLKDNKGQSALNLLKNIPDKNNSYEIQILMAQGYAEIEKPEKSLEYYQAALKLASTDDERRIAYFGIAKMQSWLNQSYDLINTYQLLLKESLNQGDAALVKKELKKYQLIYKNEQLKRATEYVLKDKGKEALVILTPFLKEKIDYPLAILAAQAYAEVENPKQSLEYYQKAFHIAKTVSQKHNAMFGSAKMQSWLGMNMAAMQSYHHLLNEKLSAADYRIAHEGWLNSLENIHVDAAKKYISDENGKEAVKEIKGFLCYKVSYNLLILLAQAYSISDDAVHALIYYRAAYAIAKDAGERKVALFGIARMHFWLANYVRAEDTFHHLLDCYQLNKKEYELALAGMVKSLAYYDRPRRGYWAIPCEFCYTTPELVIASAQATTWAGWSDITQQTLHEYAAIIERIDKKSSLWSDYRDLKWQADLATWPNVISPTFFYSSDSDEFIKKYSTLDYTHYWNHIFQSSLGLEHIIYTQNGFPKLIARGFYASQTVQPTRATLFKVKIEPFSYNNWSPILWNASAQYKPIDNVFLQLNALREIVETFPAFDNRITDNQYAASATISPFPYLKLDSSIYRLDFSDKNFRDGYYFSASYDVLSDMGLSAVGILRGYRDKFKSPYYFSPHSYRAETFILRIGRKLGQTWHYYLDGGIGRQYIIPLVGDPVAESPTHQWGIGITGPVCSRVIFSLFYADVFQASAFVNSNGYHYQYGAATLNIML